MKYSAVSKVGSREINEDSFLCVEDGSRWLFAVADGLGGHGHGEVASALAVKTLQTVFEESGDLAPDALLEKAVLQAQEAILAEQEAKGAHAEMKTTLVAVCGNGETVCWVHVGDTRLYAFSGNKIAVRTLDHSIPQMLVMAGEIPERKIRNHPQRNMLLRVLGIPWDSPKHVLSPVSESGTYQAFLLCSDGFWELVKDREMASRLKRSSSPEEWLDKLSTIVEKRGRGKDMDNFTAVAVWI